MFNNLAVTLWNFKGGVGKSTIALTLAEIAASSGLRVLAVEHNERHNLAHVISGNSTALICNNFSAQIFLAFVFLKIYTY